MIKISAFMEDLYVEAEYVLSDTGYEWQGRITDLPTGSNKTFAWTEEQFGAVMALGLFSGEQYKGYNVDDLYEVVEPLFKDWPVEFRLVP